MRPRQEQSWLCVASLYALPICPIDRYTILIKYGLIHPLSEALSSRAFRVPMRAAATQPPTYLTIYLKET